MVVKWSKKLYLFTDKQWPSQINYDMPVINGEISRFFPSIDWLLFWKKSFKIYLKFIIIGVCPVMLTSLIFCYTMSDVMMSEVIDFFLLSLLSYYKIEFHYVFLMPKSVARLTISLVNHVFSIKVLCSMSILCMLPIMA